MNIWEMVIEVILFVGASYLIFYRSYIKELGKKVAELSIVKELTEKVESVKKKFNEDLEIFRGNVQKDIEKEIAPLKASLDKANIGFQIYTSEYARLRFQRLDDLYGSLYYFKEFVIKYLINYIPNDQKEFEERRQLYFSKSSEMFDKFQLAVLYLDDDAQKAVFNLISECDQAFGAFIEYKNSSPAFTSVMFSGKSLIDLMNGRNEKSFERLLAARDKFPEILSKIEKEFKRNLTYTDIK